MRPVMQVNLLLFTKNTRLMNDEGAYDKIKAWPQEQKDEHLDYMLNTIKSSWEFIDYTFDIRDVSRGFTHQFVRTRQGSYAQQSQRTVDMTGFEYYTPERIIADGMAKEIYDGTNGNNQSKISTVDNSRCSCRRCQRNITN